MTRQITVDDLVPPDNSATTMLQTRVMFSKAKNLIQSKYESGELDPHCFEALNLIVADGDRAMAARDYHTLYAAAKLILLWFEGCTLETLVNATDCAQATSIQ